MKKERNETMAEAMAVTNAAFSGPRAKQLMKEAILGPNPAVAIIKKYFTVKKEK